MYRIMVVDDEEGILKAVKRELAEEAYAVECFSNVDEALNCAQATHFDLVISDYRMPNMDGVKFLGEFRRSQPDAARIILSGHSDFDAVMAAINEAEIYRFVSKPWHKHELMQTISQALQHNATLLENRRLADEVRRQRAQLENQQQVLANLERESPGITQVRWAEDGSILLDEN